jgi:hypothetical protein
MSDEDNKLLVDLLTKFTLIEAKFMGAKALNGGFDKLAEDVASIAIDVRSIKKAMYEPDSGLYTRIRDLEKAQHIDEEHHESIMPIIAAYPELLIWRNRVDDDAVTLSALKDRVKELTDWKANANKVVWALIMLTIASWGKTFIEMV